MRLAIISDCIHVKTGEGLFGSDVHIFVRQMEALSIYFTEVHICCPFIHYNNQIPITTYTSSKIKFVPLKKVGGTSIQSKIELLIQIPTWFKAFHKLNKLADIVYQRFPNNLNIPGFFYFYCINKKVFATYTGTWEKNNQESLTYTFQKWLLKHFFKGPIGVYSTNNILPAHVFSSFSPSYSNTEWLEETQQVQNRIEYLKQSTTVYLSLVTVGSFTSYKNQQYILDTCLLLKTSKVPFHLYMVGDGELRNQYKDFIYRNNLQEDVTLTGKLAYTKVKELYRKVNFVVQSPTVEGFGKVPIEAYFHGAIPIINNISMSAYITQNATLGYLFSVDDSKGLYNLLLQITEQPHQVAERIEHARNFVQQFTLEAWANQYYQQILKHYPQLEASKN